MEMVIFKALVIIWVIVFTIGVGVVGSEIIGEVKTKMEIKKYRKEWKKNHKKG